MRLRIISASIVLGIAAAWSGWTQPPGDVDGSGVVTSDDTDLLLNHLLELTPLEASAEERANCNGQDGLDAGDLVWIVNHEGFRFPDMVTVEAASFEMGDPWGEGFSNEMPVHTVMLSTYEIGRFEVTNADYTAFLNTALAAGEITITGSKVFLTGNSSDPLFSVYEPTTGLQSSLIEYSGGTFTARTREGHSMNNHPVVWVSWYGAAAYCNWLSREMGYDEVYEVYPNSGLWYSVLSRNGYHLPTEAQWERAAAWEPGHGHWRYGFQSDSIGATRANFRITTTVYVNPVGFTSGPYTSPVGLFDGTSGREDSPSDAGCYDMSGNVSEWCNDWWRREYTADPVTDPQGPPWGSFRMLRGGSWLSPWLTSRSAHRSSQHPYNMTHFYGFRIARNP